MPLGSRLRVSFKQKFLARELVRYQQCKAPLRFVWKTVLLGSLHVCTDWESKE